MEASAERDYLLALSWIYRNRTRQLKQLLTGYGSATEVWKHINEKGMNEAIQRAERENSFIEKHNICVLTDKDILYPKHLSNCVDAPILLFGKGNLQPNKGKMVSIVGTRSCTDRGRENTRQLVLDLANLLPDITIVSGLAYGIDIAAHKAALEANIPTIIIAGHGLDRIYPAVHRNVAIASLEQGGILTEYLSGTEPERYNFVARDRIIAGVADAVVVVESKQHGGSLITAQMASDYSCPLFAFPGRIQDDASRGCNQLIREQKATLIENAKDLVKSMMWDELVTHKPIQTEMLEFTEDLDETATLLLHKLHEQEEGIQINSLVIETQLPYNKISSTLMMMELKNIVKGYPGGVYRALK